MNQEDQVQAYIEGLQEKATTLTGTRLEVAKYMITLAESTYLRGDEEDYFQMETADQPSIRESAAVVPADP